MTGFEEGFLERLEALRLAVRKAVRSRREGERATGRRGGGAVFHSHRPYAQGDDVRAIDWTVYARLESLFVREREREEAAPLTLLLDASASMSAGTPPKAVLARRLAGALGYLALSEGGPVTLISGSDSRRFAPGAAREFLAAAHSMGKGPIPDDCARRIPAGSVAVVLSDFWDEDLPTRLEASVPAVAGQDWIHVLGRDELEPAESGMLRFVDAESGEAVVRHVGPEELEEYRRHLDAHLAGVQDRARRRGIGYLRCPSDDAVERVVLLALRVEGILE